jgi:2-iminobutanoate/2-iminopropanoate deaminase
MDGERREIEPVSTNNAPAPGGHYSQAVIANGLVFVAGQLPTVPGRGSELPVGIDAQASQALANVAAILEAAGSSLKKLVSVTIYVTDIAHWPAVNRVYAEALGDHRPARAVAVSPQLHFGSLVEIQAIALHE